MTSISPPQPKSSSSVLNASNVGMHRRDVTLREHIVSTVTLHPDEDFQTTQVNFSRRVPDWLWAVLTAMLGIDTDTSMCRHLVAVAMRVLTIYSALIFIGCGVVFKIFDVISENTPTTMLDAIGDALLAAYWVGMGVYARSLAARLFSNSLFVECIQMHSKTIFKMNTAIIIMVLSIACVGINLYANRTLLEWHAEDGESETNVTDDGGTCIEAGIHVALCNVYFVARLMFSAVALLWNLLVASILLSVCRTHTISIRRFMKELLYDSKIYEEFVMLQGLASLAFPTDGNLNQRERPQTMTAILEGKDWENSITDWEEDETRPPSNAVIFNTMRNIRQSAYDSNSLGLGPQRPVQSLFLETIDDLQDTLTNYVSQENGDVVHRNCNDVPRSGRSVDGEDNQHLIKFNTILQSLGEDEVSVRRALETGQPPIMSSEDLLFKYYQIVRRLSSTSSSLQRWMSSIISLTLLWCALFILYWTTNEVTWLGLFMFVLPLVIVYLLTSAYAEVNFEAGRIVKSALPTPERVESLNIMRQTPPELKVYSFHITHNAIMTVVAGVAISFATSLVMEQIKT